MELTIGVAGYVTMELIRRDGSIKERLTFKNLLTNIGLDQIMGRLVAGSSRDLYTLTTAGVMSAAVGSGSSVPLRTNTGLASEITPATAANRASTDGGYLPSGPTYVAGPPDYWYRRASFLFDYAESNGNLTEVGLLTATSGGDLFMRQLLQDSGGNPTTLIKTSNEQLRVVYEFRVYLPTNDLVQSVVISGVTYTATTRAANANQATAWGSFDGVAGSYMSWAPTNRPGLALETSTLGARTSYPSGSSVQCGTMTASAYTNGNYYRDIRYEWAIGIANFGTGIGSIVHGPINGSSMNQQLFQTSFSPKLSKDATKRLRLDARYTVDRV